MSENEVKVPLHNDRSQKSYSSMEKKATGEILNVTSTGGPFENEEQKVPLRGTEVVMNETKVPNGTKIAHHEFADIKVFTLNCWGLYGLSKNRKERMEAIGNYLSTSEHDIVLLQEVWTSTDFEMIRHLVRDAFPFSHFFNSGIIGSGTCIFTRVQLQDANFHEFAMNGYPTSLLHGDWYAAKGVGVCQIDLHGFNIHIFVSHYHAEYDPKNDVYLGHRVIHALESAQWIKLTSSSADLTIYGGDFNTEPTSVPYRLLRAVSNLSDAWVENGDEAGGETNETSYNSFTPPGSIAKRIDYVMYRAGPGVVAQTESCNLPLPHMAPNLACSYSDHEGVAAVIRIQREIDQESGQAVPYQSGPEFRRLLSRQRCEERSAAVGDAVSIVERSIRAVSRKRVKYIIYCFTIIILLVISYIPSVSLDSSYHFALDIGLLLPRLIITVLLVVNFLMATLFNKKEKNALRETCKQLQLILNHHVD